jgi:major membrane immunogen (membrane-anchored lipoprotein)
VSGRNTPLVVVLLAFCALLAACGSSSGSRLSANQYRARLATISRRADKAHADLEKGMRSNSVVDMRSGLSRFAVDQETVA